MKTMRIEWTYDDQIEVTIRDDEGVRPVRVCVSSNNLHHLFGELVPKSMQPLLYERICAIWETMHNIPRDTKRQIFNPSQPTED